MTSERGEVVKTCIVPANVASARKKVRALISMHYYNESERFFIYHNPGKLALRSTISIGDFFAISSSRCRRR